MHNSFRKSSSQPQEKGYILLLSVLISSIILAISFGVYAISIKEIILASYLKDSAKAFATADRAMECALYWDRSFPQNGMPNTIFPTSTDYVAPWVIDPVVHDQSTVLCEGQQITDPGASPAGAEWLSGMDSISGTTTFKVLYTDGTCAEVRVEKDTTNGSLFTSNGYNTCDNANPRQINRTIQVTSNI